MKLFRHLLAVFSPLLLLSVAGGCRHIDSVGYSNFVTFDKEGIPQGWEFDFSPMERDSAALISTPHDAVVVVRYTNTCPSRSIILDIEELSLVSDKPDSLRVEIPLFDKEGIPLGRGNFGIFEVTDTIHRNMKVPEGYVISVSSPLPTNLTEGVNAIGLILSRPRVDTTFWERLF